LTLARLGAVMVSTTCVFGFAATSSKADASPLVGRWQTVRTCHGLVAALQKYGLSRLAPSVVGDYFPSKTPAQLAKKTNVCAGAKPQLHSHFFTADGKFGSLDQHSKQVDDGSYSVITSSTVKINEGLFRFRVLGQELTLTPLLTKTQKRKALANPLKFSTAGWMVAVSYVGHNWHSVPCDQWC
jgi:hypothetical protein